MKNASIHQIKMYLQILSNCCLRLNDSDAPIFKVNEQIVAILRIFLNSLVLFQYTVGKRIAQTQKVNLKLNSNDISLIQRFIHTNLNSIKKKECCKAFSKRFEKIQWKDIVFKLFTDHNCRRKNRRVARRFEEVS